MSTKQETVLQHFVPKTYLKRFSLLRNNEYYINAFPKGTRNPCKLFETNITNICAKKNIYTLKGNIKERQLLEDIYSNIFENEYDTIYKLLTDNSISDISSNLKLKIIETVITMFYRTKKWITSINEFSDNLLNKTYLMCKQSKKSSFIDSEGNRISIRNKTLEEIQSERRDANRIFHVISQLQIAEKLIDIMQNSNINVFEIKEDIELITSDNPVLFKNIHHKLSIPFDKENVYYLPINSKFLLSIFPNENSHQLNKIIRLELKKQGVKRFNEIQESNSEMFILGTESSIESYLNCT